MQNANLDETMTEEEFFEWLQNAVQSGAFESFSTESESPSAQSGSCSKSGLKKKRKGKKQWWTGMEIVAAHIKELYEKKVGE